MVFYEDVLIEYSVSSAPEYQPIYVQSVDAGEGFLLPVADIPGWHKYPVKADPDIHGEAHSLLRGPATK